MHQAILTGGQVLKITIDPFVGGATIVEVHSFRLSKSSLHSKPLLRAAFLDLCLHQDILAQRL